VHASSNPQLATHDLSAWRIRGFARFPWYHFPLSYHLRRRLYLLQTLVAAPDQLVLAFIVAPEAPSRFQAVLAHSRAVVRRVAARAIGQVCRAELALALLVGVCSGAVRWTPAPPLLSSSSCSLQLLLRSWLLLDGAAAGGALGGGMVGVGGGLNPESSGAVQRQVTDGRDHVADASRALVGLLLRDRDASVADAAARGVAAIFSHYERLVTGGRAGSGGGGGAPNVAATAATAAARAAALRPLVLFFLRSLLPTVAAGGSSAGGSAGDVSSSASLTVDGGGTGPADTLVSGLWRSAPSARCGRVRCLTAAFRLALSPGAPFCGLPGAR
jgi:hypothetical protein